MAANQKKMFSSEYPGRIIIIGRDPSDRFNVIVYAITGRSPSSQARKLEMEGDSLWIKPTNRETIQKGNVDLLVYPALFAVEQGIAVSNGKQTVDIMASLGHSRNASEVLAFSLQKWEYEPDRPNYTPRISGCVLPSGSAALHIVKREAAGSVERHLFEFPLTKGKGRMISTYSGINTDPLPSFQGVPLKVDINAPDGRQIAEDVYHALSPEQPEKDFRVSVACLTAAFDHDGPHEVSIINRIEREKNHGKTG